MEAYEWPDEIEEEPIIWNKETVELFTQLYEDFSKAFQPHWLEWAGAYNALAIERGRKERYKFELINVDSCEFMGFNDYGEVIYSWSYQYDIYDRPEGQSYSVPISLFYDKAPIEEMNQKAIQLRQENDAKQALVLEKSRIQEIRKAELAAEKELKEYQRLHEKYG